MARTLTPNDAHSIMNDVTRETSGASAFAVIDSSSFVSSVETVLATVIENTPGTPDKPDKPDKPDTPDTFMITVHPADFYGKIGETAVFTVEAIGTGLAYQWQYQNKGTQVWRLSGASGNDTSTVNVPITRTRNGQKYRCIITDENKNSLTSNEASIHVIK